MEELANRRRGPFIVVAALFAAICIVVVAIPDSVLALLANNRPLTLAQAGWAYRILAFFAVGQIVYTGMSVFRIERLDALREKDDRFARLSKPAVISSLSRNAAALVFFTLVYGIASLILTAQRGGFWLFPMLAVAQGAWYYREIGQVAEWKAFQADAAGDDSVSTAWSAGSRDYCPPLARGLRPLEGAAKTGD
jgi:hypothetical protein